MLEQELEDLKQARLEELRRVGQNCPEQAVWTVYQRILREAKGDSSPLTLYKGAGSRQKMI
jgi:hypothetical protein